MKTKKIRRFTMLYGRRERVRKKKDCKTNKTGVYLWTPWFEKKKMEGA